MKGKSKQVNISYVKKLLIVKLKIKPMLIDMSINETFKKYKNGSCGRKVGEFLNESCKNK